MRSQMVTMHNNLVFPLQVKVSADEVIKKQSKTTQPTLWCSLDEEGLLDQAFVVVKQFSLKFLMLLT